MAVTRAAAVATALAGLLAASCGVPDDASVERVADAPAAVGPSLDATASTTSAPAPPAADAPVYFIRGSRLAVVTRSVHQPTEPGDLVLLLAAGPTSAEADEGMRTAVPRGVEVLPRSGGVTIELGPFFEDLPDEDEILALGQLALTLGGSGSVRFLLGGDPATVPRPDGSLTDEAISADVFRALLE